jgi:dTDP-4-amino-4,6-dideoxygalactose transaminase
MWSTSDRIGPVVESNLRVMKKIPVLIPVVPDLDDVSSLLRKIHDSKWYTNHGPIDSQLRMRFSTLLGRPQPETIALFSSGTLALAACIRAWGLPQGSRCLVPSWTFAGTVCSLVLAGLVPVFIDVDRETWIPTLGTLHDARRKTGAAAAVIVAPFGGDVTYPQWVEYSKQFGTSIAIDAAAGFDMVEKLARSGTPLPLPIMVSLHATKLVTSLEGGLIVWDDVEAVRRATAWSNFGIFDRDPVNLIGCNAKPSEVHAAYGVRSLDNWNSIRRRMVHLADRYVELISARRPQIGFAPNVRARLATSTFNITSPEFPTVLKST